MTASGTFRSRILIVALLTTTPTALIISPALLAASGSITDSTPEKSRSKNLNPGEAGPTDPQLHGMGADSKDASSGSVPAKSESGVRATLRELLQNWLPSSDNDEEAGSGETAEAEGGTPEALDGNVIAPTDVLTKDELAHAIPWRPTNFEGQKGALGWSPSTFDVPEAFKNRVAFWRDIYSKYSTDQGVIHDTLYISFVYATMDFTAISRDASKSPAQRARAREALIKDKKKEIMARLERLKGHTTAEGLAGEDLRVWKLFEHINDPEKFTAASDKGRVRFQLGQRDKFVLGIFYSGRYLRTMEKIFRDEGLPMELTRLPFVESSFNVNARSRVGASGVWQFMRRTAKPFMKVNRDLDERNEPIKATRASARVLKQNYMMLESWPLALTGYNHGPYGVRGIVNKTHTRDLGEIIAKYSSRTFGFASENFYACFLAALDVERHAHKYFGDVKWSAEIESTEIKVTNNTPYRTLLDLFAGDNNMTELLNPQFSSRVRTGRAPIPKGASIRVLPAVVAIANQAVSGKLGGTRLAVAVKAVAKDLAPLKGAGTPTVASSSPSGGGMQSGVRGKIEQVGQAAQAAMPTLTMTDGTGKSTKAHDGVEGMAAKLDSLDKTQALAAKAPRAAVTNVSTTSAPAGAKPELAAPSTKETLVTAVTAPAEKTAPVPVAEAAKDVAVATEASPNAKANGELAEAKATSTSTSTSTETKTHKVRRGENLTHIASEYGVDLLELQKLNHLESRRGRKKGQIRVGQILTIPEVATAANSPSMSNPPSNSLPNSPMNLPAHPSGTPAAETLTLGADTLPPTGGAESARDANGEKLLDAKVLPGATATPGATPHLNSH